MHRANDMVKRVCCVVLAAGAVACTPPMAVLVEEAPPAPARQTDLKAVEAPAGELEPVVVQQSGMRIPDPTRRLPDQRDMSAVTPAPTGGGTIASPPSPVTPGSE